MTMTAFWRPQLENIKREREAERLRKEEEAAEDDKKQREV
jgi:hypothetical protein